MNEQPAFKAEDVSILAWTLKNGIKSEKGEPLDFSDRLFLLPILCDWSKNIAWKKCSQVGGSVVFNVKALFAILKLGLNVIYTHPSDSDVEEFVKTKTNPILKENFEAFPGVSVDSVYLKQVGKRNLFFKGTISKTAAISTSADLVIHDEASRSDQQAMAFYQSRLKASEYRGTWLFSNPTTDKDILDENWQKSDQKEWHVTCSNGHREMLSWLESIDKERKCFQCKRCKVELTRDERRRGVWINRDGVVWSGKLEAPYTISGWHTSHLMAPWISAEDILQESEGDQEYFYNFVLGEPYNPGDLKITRSFILDNWTPKDIETGRWYLGVDVGNIKHYCLGSERGIVKVGKFTRWKDLDDMMRLYKPTLVIDAMPDTTMSRYFVDTYLNAYMSFFQDNANNPQTIVWWGEGDKKGIVYSNRNRILDQLVDEILQAQILFAVPSDNELRDYVNHWLTMRRVKVVNSKGIESYEWQSTNDVDHYCFATLYYRLAVKTVGSGEFFPNESPKEPVFITNNNVVTSFGALLQETYDE